MKSNAPWSVKGIERKARETAKDAAKREGMTVGEWLNQMIYQSGTPQESNGEIEGLKVTDLVTAIEQLNKRMAEADEASAEAIGDLSRNIGGVVERVQRLERVKPAEGTHDDLAQRIEKLEERSGDRQRVDALKALEKAVGQVAVQFNTAHKTSIERIEANEKQLQQLASRIEEGGGADGDVSAVGYLKDAIDGLSARITRAERIAAEANNLKGDAAGSVDPDFVERTGARLRVLGEEIKRGGDQISSFEATIAKLSDQIEAAERRSSEGVNKVSETIAQLHDQFARADEADNEQARAEIEAAVAEATQKTDDRITSLQSSFDKLVDRLSTLNGDDHDSTAIAPPSFEVEDETAEIEEDIDQEIESLIGDDPVEDTKAETEEIEDGLSFELDDEKPEAAQAPSEAESLLSEVQQAFTKPEANETAAGTAGESQAPEAAADTPAPDADDDLDSILADLDNIGSDDSPEQQTVAEPAENASEERADVKALLAGAPPKITKTPESEQTETADTPKEETTGTVAGAVKEEDFLKAARRKAKEAAERNAEEAKKPKRRNLTPKQKAILAARARRKKLEAKNSEEGVKAQSKTAKAAPTPNESTVDEDTDEETSSGPLSKLTGAFASLTSRFKKSDDDDDEKTESVSDAETTTASPDASDEDDEDQGHQPFAAIKSGMAARPVTLALGGAILLAVLALAYLINDLVFKSPSSLDQPPVAQAPTTTSGSDTQTTAPSLREEDAPTVPAAPLVNPRELYLEATTALNAATTEEETAAAISTLQEAAALGHPPAQLQLGELYKLGQGVDQDLGRARTWFRRSANGGNILAMHRVGVMTARGDGGLADTNEAIGWFELAANRGLVDSQYNLGAIYHPSGDGSPIQDAGKAYYWYSLAALNGDEQAAPLAAGVGSSLSSTERQELDAAIQSWTEESADPIANELAPAT